MVDQRDYIDISRRERDEAEQLQRAPPMASSSTLSRQLPEGSERSLEAI